MQNISSDALKACHCCGLVQQIPVLDERNWAFCVRCESRLDVHPRQQRQSASRCFAAAIGGLLLYFPAILLPIIEIKQLGFKKTSSLLGGTIDLLLHGSWFVGSVVLLFSIVLPFVKLLALLELSQVGLSSRRHRALTYRVVEWTGRWSMMDVLLLALLVATVKLGDLVTFELGPAVIAFVLCVVMSLIASMVFDPHVIWEEVADDATAAANELSGESL